MRTCLAAALVLAALLPALVARAEVDGNRWTDDSGGAELHLPPEWALTEQPSYPGFLVAGVQRPGSGRLSLVRHAVGPDETAKSVSERSRKALEKVGFTIARLFVHPSGAVVLEASSPDGRTQVRQGYRVAFGWAYVLTLAMPSGRRGLARTFDDALRGLAISRRAVPPPPAPTGPSEPAPLPGAIERDESPRVDPGSSSPQRPPAPPPASPEKPSSAALSPRGAPSIRPVPRPTDAPSPARPTRRGTGAAPPAHAASSRLRPAELATPALRREAPRLVR